MPAQPRRGLRSRQSNASRIVVPANAGTHLLLPVRAYVSTRRITSSSTSQWVPACAGTTYQPGALRRACVDDANLSHHPDEAATMDWVLARQRPPDRRPSERWDPFAVACARFCVDAPRYEQQHEPMGPSLRWDDVSAGRVATRSVRPHTTSPLTSSCRHPGEGRDPAPLWSAPAIAKGSISGSCLRCRQPPTDDPSSDWRGCPPDRAGGPVWDSAGPPRARPCPIRRPRCWRLSHAATPGPAVHAVP